MSTLADTETSLAVHPADTIEPHILAKLDPDFVQYYVDVLSKVPPAQAVTIEEVRAHPERFRAAIALDSSEFERVRDYEVTSEDGAKIPVRVYHPDPEKHGSGPYPVHLNFHGKAAQACISGYTCS
jgi:acetyl esterase/lipase